MLAGAFAALGKSFHGFPNEGRDSAVPCRSLGPLQKSSREPDHDGAVRLLVGDLWPAALGLSGL